MIKFEPNIFSEKYVEGIKQFIDKKRREFEKNGMNLNPIIREDIFPLLDSCCTVVYFPSTDTKNNGFHKTYHVYGEEIHFVYINTAQYTEKQIFTAAHELGHIWGLDSFLEDNYSILLSKDESEHIMNRFAAELLMPEEAFLSYFEKKINRICDEKRIVSISSLLAVITDIMNEFFVPYKSVIYRLYELHQIPERETKLLWGDTETLPKEIIEAYIKQVAHDLCFTRLFRADKQKGIDGLKELLDSARDSGTMPKKWLDAFYKRFEIPNEKINDSLSDSISICSTKEGGE